VPVRTGTVQHKYRLIQEKPTGASSNAHNDFTVKVSLNQSTMRNKIELNYLSFADSFVQRFPFRNILSSNASVHPLIGRFLMDDYIAQGRNVWRW
jgi:hypothetical protein